MIRCIALGSLLALATAGLGAFSTPARAADPVGQQAQRARRHLWWNAPAVVEKLSLTGEQRAQMDKLFEAYQSAQRSSAGGDKARGAFHEALEQGEKDRARRELDSWAEGERALILATGELKIGVFSLLSEEQRNALESVHPRLVRQLWVPRLWWGPRPAPAMKRPTEEKPAN